MTEDKTQKRASDIAVFASAGAVQPIMPRSLDELSRLARFACAMVGLNPSSEKDVAKVAGIMQAGMELGMKPMAAYRCMDVIQAKGGGYLIKLNAAGVRALCLSSPVCALFDVYPVHDNNGTVIAAKGHGKRADNGLERTVQATRKEFQHLIKQTSKGNDSVWMLYTEDMLIARATGRLGKRLFGDVIEGVAIDGEMTAEEYEQHAQTQTQVHPAESAKAADVEVEDAEIVQEQEAPIETAPVEPEPKPPLTNSPPKPAEDNNPIQDAPADAQQESSPWKKLNRSNQ